MSKINVVRLLMNEDTFPLRDDSVYTDRVSPHRHEVLMVWHRSSQGKLTLLLIAILISNHLDSSYAHEMFPAVSGNSIAVFTIGFDIHHAKLDDQQSTVYTDRVSPHRNEALWCGAEARKAS
ncbi:hypothetical protein LOTGIDRAFT_173735 [Lottia gigantea]|uniref:Uncharacterized protein n=1 Tax=Lottia gigantea TaxID=225164 RepID=V4B0H1_LOTGI|nr:hypothetical protein LOTGIDRAFT_173735 [Lottia gigantea]ESO99591.1 hypothetical protein LOTGIDRAFT_173735 [Lottia gigantea]